MIRDLFRSCLCGPCTARNSNRMFGQKQVCSLSPVSSFSFLSISAIGLIPFGPICSDKLRHKFRTYTPPSFHGVGIDGYRDKTHPREFEVNRVITEYEER